MRSGLVLRHEFVEHIPPVLEEHTVYISMAYATAVHRCACGCGREVVTPLSPTDWALRFDGETVSLDPSIGNWSFECESHYWIRRNKVQWAGRWSDEEIVAGRARDRRLKSAYFGHDGSAGPGESTRTTQKKADGGPRAIWRWLRQKWMRKDT